MRIAGVAPVPAPDSKVSLVGPRIPSSAPVPVWSDSTVEAGRIGLSFPGQPVPGPPPQILVPPKYSGLVIGPPLPPPVLTPVPQSPPLQVAGGAEAWGGFDLAVLEAAAPQPGVVHGGGATDVVKKTGKFVAKALVAPITPTGIAKSLIQTAGAAVGIPLVNALIGSQPPSAGVFHGSADPGARIPQKGEHRIL